MLFTLSNGKSVEVTGYDEYVKEFEANVISDLKNDAEKMLLNELEEEFADYDVTDYGFEFDVESPYYTRGYSFIFFNEEAGDDGRYVVKYSSCY